MLCCWPWSFALVDLRRDFTKAQRSPGLCATVRLHSLASAPVDGRRSTRAPSLRADSTCQHLCGGETSRGSRCPRARCLSYRLTGRFRVSGQSLHGSSRAKLHKGKMLRFHLSKPQETGEPEPQLPVILTKRGPGPLSLGREKNCDVVLEGLEKMASRYHCVLQCKDL